MIIMETYTVQAVGSVTEWACPRCGKDFFIDDNDYSKNKPTGKTLILPCPHCGNLNSWAQN